MALDLIRERLSAECDDQYTCVEEFVVDVRLIFKNCFKFHVKDSDYYKYAKFLEDILERELEVWRPDLAYDDSISMTTVNAKKNAKARPRMRSEDEDEEEEVANDEEEDLMSTSSGEDDDDDDEEEDIESESSLSETEKLNHLDRLEERMRRQKREKKKQKEYEFHDEEEKEGRKKVRDKSGNGAKTKNSKVPK